MADFSNIKKGDKIIVKVECDFIVYHRHYKYYQANVVRVNKKSFVVNIFGGVTFNFDGHTYLASNFDRYEALQFDEELLSKEKELIELNNLFYVLNIDKLSKEEIQTLKTIMERQYENICTNV